MAELEYEKHPGEHYAILRLNRPQRLNALGRGLLREFSDALDDFEQDPAMRCGIVTGTGRAFSAGADLKEMAERNAATQESRPPSRPARSTPTSASAASTHGGMPAAPFACPLTPSRSSARSTDSA